MLYNFDDLAFHVLNINLYTHRCGSFDVKPRAYAAISYRVSGSGIFEVDGKRLAINPGDVLFLPSDRGYRVEYSGGDSIVVHMDQCNYHETESYGFLNAAAIELRFRRLLEVWGEKHSQNAAKSLIYEILEAMLDDKRASDDHIPFARGIRYLEENFCDPELDVESVCAYCFVSASSLQRAFRAHCGMSPKQYLQKLRLRRASELLVAGQLSVKEIAYASGYRDEKYFSRAFKRQYGFPPSHLRSGGDG